CITKRIPSQAGLGGGSADAAAVLTALRVLFAPNMPNSQLRQIGAQVGADVPFCLTGGCCLAQGVGERLTPLPCLPAAFSVALVKPRQGVRTEGAYAALDAVALAHPQTALAVEAARAGDWPTLFSLCANVFEQVSAPPGLARAKTEARRAGALLTQMTGSGSAVFGVLRVNLRQPQQDAIVAALRALDSRVLLCKPVNRGVEII
ncbi:MAG: 4-(cytidine 5'-diphospho)-2-C-methyl-D-erythritol kinase, partial [Oscillospiraceae bacterium]|nr:4-(cytidine 5'-diphospho)-2-C-methyl-D-erythritol kinase [Oscillospiraceae bacterium]